MVRITQIQNITGANITINNILIVPNGFYLSDKSVFAWWLGDDYLSLYESNSVRIYFFDGSSMTYAANGSDFTNAFIYTANYYRTNFSILQEDLNFRGQVQTNNDTLTILTEIAYPNGEFQPQFTVNAKQLNNNNRYFTAYQPKIFVINNVLSFSGSPTAFAQITNSGFNTGSGFGVSISAVGNRMRISVRGRNPDPILWPFELLKR